MVKIQKSGDGGHESGELLLPLEDIIYEIRKDVGQRKKLGKGDALSIFINDIENIIKKN